MFFDIELNVLQNSVKEYSFSKIAVRLQLCYKKPPSQVFYKKNYLEEHF